MQSEENSKYHNCVQGPTADVVPSTCDPRIQEAEAGGPVVGT